MSTGLRLAIACGLMGALWPGFGQPPAPQTDPDTTVYESFLRQANAWMPPPGHAYRVLRNGKPSDALWPSLQNAIGLTDSEVQDFKKIASDCQSKLDFFNASIAPKLFEARVQLAGAEDDLQAAQQLGEFENEHQKIVLAHVRQLRAAFGDSRFNVLDAFVRSRQIDAFIQKALQEAREEASKQAPAAASPKRP